MREDQFEDEQRGESGAPEQEMTEEVNDAGRSEEVAVAEAAPEEDSAAPEEDCAAPEEDCAAAGADPGEPEPDSAEAPQTSGIVDRLLRGLKGLWRGFRSWKTWQQVLAAVLAAVILIAAAAYGYFHSKYILMDISDGVSTGTEAFDEEETEELQATVVSREESGELVEAEVIESTGEVASDEDVINILLIGTDERTAEFSDNARGDTCMLVSVNRNTGTINLVSFERATGVKIPYGEYEGQWDWLTHMFWYGGADMMMSVIEENYKIDVDKYIRVNITTFMELIDAVGGIDVELTEAEAAVLNDPTGTYTEMHIRSMHVADEAQHDLVVGENHLNGATAMLYVRLRSIDDDWHRVVRQRTAIMAIAENLKSLSLTELDAMLNSVLPLVQTNLTEADIASLLVEVPSFLEMDFGSITFPLDNTYGLMDGMEGRRVFAVDFETNAQELQSLLYGETTAEELEEKYDEIEGYSYRNSASYQTNYADAESQVGSGSVSSSSSSSAVEMDDEEVDGDAAADVRTFDTYVGAAGSGTAGEDETADTGTSGSTSDGTEAAAGSAAGTDSDTAVTDTADTAEEGAADTAAAGTGTVTESAADTSLSTDTGSFLSDAFVAAE